MRLPQLLIAVIGLVVSAVTLALMRFPQYRRVLDVEQSSRPTKFLAGLS